MNRALLRTTLAVLAATTLATCGGAPGTEHDADQPATANDARWSDAPTVVMLSLDGFRWDYPDRYPTPAFGRMMADGARAERMIPIFPSKTFPTHYAVATGMYAEHHGLVGNTFWAPDKGAAYSSSDRTVVEDGSWYRGEPIWVTAELQGMRTASYFFVGSEADIEGVRPTYWHRYDGTVPDAQRVDTVLSWLRMPDATRPHLITFYFSDLDDAGHRYGPDSQEVQDAVATVDTQIGRLLDGIDALPEGRNVYVIIVSDHGMLAAPASRAQPLDLSRYPGVRMMASGPYASLVIDEGGPERGPALRDSIQAELPEAQVWLRQDVPPRFHYSSDPRIGDLVVLAEPGATVVAADAQVGDYFTHGWDNQIPEMGAIFLARGPGIAGGQRIAPFESVNVYPFVAHLLGLTPNAGIDGSLDVLDPILDDSLR